LGSKFWNARYFSVWRDITVAEAKNAAGWLCYTSVVGERSNCFRKTGYTILPTSRTHRIGDITMGDSKRKLIWHGMFLFLLGLLTGFVETKFVNPRMGLAAHLEGVMNGTFLVALGAVWMEVRLPLKLKAAAYWSALYGAYINWATTALAGALGTGALSPITGAGHSAQPWQETLIMALFMSVGLAIIGSSILVLWGLRRGAAVKFESSPPAEAKKASGA
jgi:hydroxylaminobenzene mutase